MPATFDVIITVNGIDISAQLVDVAPIVVEAERSAARLAEFTVLLSGSVDPNSWTGKTVTIDYVDGATTHIFTGVVSDPVFDIATLTLRCVCTDDLQRIVDGKTHSELITLTGGYWSEYVFNPENTGWLKLQDILSTVSKSVELSTAGVLECHNWQNTVSPDFTFDETDIIDESLRVELVKRSNLINTVNVTFNARFERLWHRQETMNWTWPLDICDTYVRQVRFPVKQMVTDAINGGNWHFVSATYTALYASGSYTCGGSPIVWNNASPDVLIMGFSAVGALRWSQSVTNVYEFTVSAPDSVAAYGALAQDMQTSADFKSTVNDWGGDNDDYSTLPSGFAFDDDAQKFRDEIDTVAMATALDCLIATAAERINKSHRSNAVSFALPLNPAIGLQHTVKIDDTNIVAKGVVSRFRHTLELSTARAVTEIDLAISSGQSGLDTATQTWTAPSHPDISGAGAYPVNTVPTYIGGDFGAVAEDPAWWGWFVNATFITGGPDPATPTYNERLEMKFDAISDTLTQNSSNTISAPAVSIDVPHNLLTITA